MSAETYAVVFKTGFYFSFAMWVLAFLVVGRHYWATTFRTRLFNPFIIAAICVGTISVIESGFYLYVLHEQPMNIELRRVGGIILAYSLGVNAIIFMVFGLIAFHRHVDAPDAAE